MSIDKKGQIRPLNNSKFLNALPGAGSKITFWASRPELIVEKVQRAHDAYLMIAEEASRMNSPKAFEWYFIAGVFQGALSELKGRFAPSA